MKYYVFVDDNNGHFNEYYNFKTNATEQQILAVTASMRQKDPSYCRLGSHINDLLNALIKAGFNAELEENDRERCSIDKIQIPCISGNY